MWDVCLLLLSVTAAVWGPGPLLAPTGLPFACAALCGLPSRALPASVHVPWAAGVQWGRLAALVVVVDGLQCAVHRATHAGWLGARLRLSHAVHHRATSPGPDDAFRTGWADAAAQLLCPLLAALWLVRPDRTTAAVFGVAYAQWLVLLHSRPPRRLGAVLDACGRVLVTPWYHEEHHRDPTRHCAHVLRVWDVAAQRAAAWRAAAWRAAA